MSNYISKSNHDHDAEWPVQMFRTSDHRVTILWFWLILYIPYMHILCTFSYYTVLCLLKVITIEHTANHSLFFVGFMHTVRYMDKLGSMHAVAYRCLVLVFYIPFIYYLPLSLCVYCLTPSPQRYLDSLVTTIRVVWFKKVLCNHECSLRLLASFSKYPFSHSPIFCTTYLTSTWADDLTNHN